MLDMSRRKFGSVLITRGVCCAAALGCLGRQNPAGANTISFEKREQELVPASHDTWFKQLEKERVGKKPLKGALDMRRFKDPTYVLLAPIEWSSGLTPPDYAPLLVPAGFVTDMASVPKIFWSLFRPDGDYAYAAVLHDYLYWEQDRPKAEADAIFKSAMSMQKVTDFQRFVLFRAVEKFGGSAWASNAQLKAAGERRVLSVLPPNSDITWAEYKTLPMIFK
jgi:hypothetical protein